MLRFFHLPLLLAATTALPAQTRGWQNLGYGLAGSSGVPALRASAPQIGQPLDLDLRSARPSSLAYFVLGLGRGYYPVPGGTLVPLVHAALPAWTGSAGTASARLWLPLDPAYIGIPIVLQAVVFDPQSRGGIALSPALGWSIGGAPQMFGPEQQVTQISGELTGIEAGRLDGDGHDDFALGAATLDQIRVEHGLGNGSFGGTQTWAIGDAPTDIALGDFNGDGMTDVIATNHWTASVRIRWGHSSFATWSTYATGTNPWRVRTGDLNGDGLDDFVTTNYGNSNDITVRLRLQGGGFSSATYGAGDGNRDIQLGDVDGDGDLDMVYPQGIHNAVIKVRLNDGAGSFGPASSVATGSGHAENFHALALGDLDNDGDLDIVGARNAHSMVRLLGNGDGTFGQVVAAGTRPNPWRIYMHDLNLDGNQDLVLGHFGEGVTVYLGQGNGNVSGPHQFITNATQKVSDVAVADFNGDGRPDLVYAAFSGGAYVRLGL